MRAVRWQNSGAQDVSPPDDSCGEKRNEAMHFDVFPKSPSLCVGLTHVMLWGQLRGLTRHGPFFFVLFF